VAEMQTKKRPSLRRRVLIVEDESLVALDLAHSLTDIGFDVIGTVANGDDALRLAAENRPDMVLVDIRIQGEQDGIETANALRAHYQVPVVYLTAHADERTLERAIRTEPYGYLIKPFNPKELKSVMEIALYKHDVEVKLRESEENLATTLDSIADAVIATDVRGRITRMNPVACQLTGFRASEALGCPLDEVYRVRRRRASLPDDSTVRKLRRASPGERHRVVLMARDGSERPIAESIAPIMSVQGTSAGIVLVFRDQTEERRAEERERAHAEELSRSEAQLAEAQRIAHVGSWEWEARSNAASWSLELFRIMGREPDEHSASYALFQECVHPEDRQLFDATVQAALRDRQPFHLEHRIVRPSGEVRILHSGGQVLDTEGDGRLRLSATAQDITEHRTLEQQVLIAGRLSSMGTLASGVAHEINNPMTYVVGNVDLAIQQLSTMVENLERRFPSVRGADSTAVSRDPEEDSRDLHMLRDVRELLRRSAHGAERVCQIVRDLKVFSRADDPRKARAIKVEPVLESSINICWNEIRYRAQLVKDYTELPLVDANESRLGQVFVNLLVNAAHATPEGQRDKHEIRVTTRVSESGDAVIEIRDNGQGIPHATLSRIFEPFFTTKPVGVGTGLGLSICHGIVSSLGGRLEVESELGRGAMFRVVLPRSSALAGEKYPSVIPAPHIHGRILVIDDEPLVVETIRRMLQAEHEVVTLTSPREALARLSSGEHFDLILCDLMMPELTGMDLYDKLLVAAPHTLPSMVLMTGGAFTPSARRFLEFVPNPRIQKPFGQRTLQDMIGSLLRR
jgi:PAS domain S-box-containing protein